LVKDWRVSQDRKRNRAKHRQNPGEKPGSVCLLPDTGRLIHLSAGQ
jgi:hypothetical protein